MKKVVVIGIIVILIAVSIAPSINANISRLPVKSKLVETAVRIHRARGITPYTVKLTEKESDEVDRIFDNLKVSLDSAETLEETDEIFNDAVVSLYELGLFPKHMTVEEAQQLITGNSQNPSVKSHSGNLGTGDENFNCRVVGQASQTFMWDLGSLLLNAILFNLRYFLAERWNPVNFPYFRGEIGLISFGTYDENDGDYTIYPAKGWVWTKGSNGVVKWNGTFRGTLGARNVWEIILMSEGVYDGVADFEGLWIDGFYNPPCYLGNAEHVSLTYDKPPEP